MCKPNMHSSPTDSPCSFTEWKQQIQALAALPNVYMKIYGGLSEIVSLPPTSQQSEESPEERHARIEQAATIIGSYIDVVADAFGTKRIMFGSDWPMCNIGGGGNELAWRDWWWVVRSWVEKRDLDAEERIAFWAGTTRKVYRIDEL